MKVAALYDIHGNLPALEAVLNELEEIQPDLVVLGGDIVSGPFPRQTLERLQQLDLRVRAIRGNGDREAVLAFDGLPLPSHMSEEGQAATNWVGRQLEQIQRDYLASLPESLTLPLEEQGEIFFCHATPHNDEDIFTPLTPQERLDTLFANTAHPIVICGHTHMQFERQTGNTRIINSGSVGMPYAESPGAYWLLLTPEGHEFRRTEYDLEAAAQQVRESGYPQAQDFANENILKIPTATEAAEFFEQLAASR